MSLRIGQFKAAEVYWLASAALKTYNSGIIRSALMEATTAMDIGRCVNEAIDVYKKNLAQLVVAAFLLQVLSRLLLIVVLAISMAPTAIPYVGFIVGWFVTPIAWLIEAAAYVQYVDGRKQTAGHALT